MIKTKNEKLRTKNPASTAARVDAGAKRGEQNLKLKTFTLCVMVISFSLFAFRLKVSAVSPVATPTASPSASLTPASPTASQGGPTTIEDEKVSEIRQAIEDKLTQIKDKIEKKAYVGTILEITDSTLTLSSFRGKQRVRIATETKIISANKKEETVKDLAVDDKVIAMGEVDANGTLEAKRVVEVALPKTASPQRTVFLGTITNLNTKTSTLTLTNIKNLDQTLLIKVDNNTDIENPKDAKVQIKFKDFAENQKLLVVYPQPAEGKAAVAKTVFLLP